MSEGTVFWVTGLAAAGKSTIARLLFERIRRGNAASVLLDGDTLREVFGNDLGYAREERIRSAMRNARLCKLLADQGIDVVCATISLFQECHEWNRKHIVRYREIYVRASRDTLVQRDPKGLYARALRGEVANVAGVDLKVDEPTSPDAVVDNDGAAALEALVENLAKQFGIG